MCELKSITSSEEEEHLFNSVMKKVFTGHKKFQLAIEYGQDVELERKRKDIPSGGVKAKQEAKGGNEC